VLKKTPPLRVLCQYFACCHGSRPHQSLDDIAPRPAEVEPPLADLSLDVPSPAGLFAGSRTGIILSTATKLAMISIDALYRHIRIIDWIY
jgi:hypothetical protein